MSVSTVVIKKQSNRAKLVQPPAAATPTAAGAEKYILEVHTIHCMKFKNLFSVIKDLLFDCNIHFDDAGMKICDLDRSQVGLVHLRLPKDNFAVYKCAKPMMLGVSITSLHKYLGHITQNNKTTLKLLIAEDNPHELILEIVSDDDSDTQRFNMKLLDLELNPASLEGERFSCIINIPSDKFQRYCRSHSLVGDVMDIITVGDQVKFRTESESQGDRTESIIRANKEEQSSIFLADKDDMIAGRFSLKFLQMFAKAQNLAPSVVIYFKQDFPLVLLYKMAELGELKFALSPQIAPTFP